MPIFISYSHEDKGFVDTLAAHLIKNKQQVWVDRWELKVGDSLIRRIEEAIQEASALVVVLSTASIQSEWCRKELTAGLVRELEEKRVVLLPALLEECDIPLFLRDKLYADFRTNFDEGLRSIIDAVAPITSDVQGRITDPEWYSDWSLDWFFIDELLNLRITLVEQAHEEPFSVLTEVLVSTNRTATRRYREYERAGVEWFGRQFLVDALAEVGNIDQLNVILDDQKPVNRGMSVQDPKTGVDFEVSIVARRLGEDTGKSILVRIGDQLRQIRDQVRETTRRPTKEELRRVMQIVSNPPRSE